MARWTVSGLKKGVLDALIGIKLVLHNPHLKKKKYLNILFGLLGLSALLYIVTHALVTIPLKAMRIALLVWTSKDVQKLEGWLDQMHKAVLDLVSFVPVVALLFLRHVYPKPLDELFMESLRYVDELENNGNTSYVFALVPTEREKKKVGPTKQRSWQNLAASGQRVWKKVRFALLVFALSLLPIVGPHVYPLVGAYTTYKTLGNTQGVAVGICFFLLPRWATVRLIRALIGMRALMRELLEPYFSRRRLTHQEKLKWFSGRKDVLFGFSAIAYLMMRVPFVGFVGYGVAQAASAYMLTRVIEPAPRTNDTTDIDDLQVQKNK
ncbi:hypothetical protein DM01DRAFT_1385402 [Hesseltinella vesiculosa]|uniref:Transmembrane protein UsgS n=1 Tax=Hesseltinella vesiculosa TaxID=101127 RepID=A0A1X2GA06_9FUNG|nr:hypothetical protein DM01DRAFT_1385402 [Hesseltinella vesiculosa]